MGPGGDTSIGGGAAGFPHTTWGLVSRIHDPDNPDVRPVLDALALRYWKPVYRYVRLTWGKSNEDAKDITQAFLLWLLQGDALKRYEPDRGSFRKYLKLLLGRFVSHQAEALQRLKRGGGAAILRLGDEEAPLENVLADPKATDPEKAFDQAWMAELVQGAVARVRERLISDGRDAQFRAYEEYEMSSAESPTYAGVAARLGIKESDVRNHLYAVREEIRSEIRREILETTGSEGAFEEEWRELFGE
ncbi:MAG: sigma-70 family RNA polymerase sigma factor [Planctomycetes bacterium]|nr:sigma-70 family RNA polymerase sigma factor [Planctomycetota bacterium]